MMRMGQAAAPFGETLASPVRTRLDGIDVLRGLCVLLVVLHHIHLRFWLNDYPVEDALPKPVNQVLFWSGYYAVITFFVISGFLITNLSIHRWGSPGNIQVRHFYVMRLARIAPCLILLLVSLCALHLSGVPEFTIEPERASLLRALVAALTFHVNWLEGHHGYLPGGWDILWSLSVEETFYLAFPLLCVFLRNELILLWPLLCLIVIGPINRALLADQDPWGDYAYLSCMDGIAFGCVAALVCARRRLAPRALHVGMMLGATAALLVVVFCNEDVHTGLSRYGLNVTVLELGISLVLLALGSGVGNAALSTGTRWLRTIGRSSYEIYLFHMLVILGLMNLFKRVRPSAAMIPVWYLTMLVLSVVLGYGVSRLYSEPLNLKLRRRYLAFAAAILAVASVPGLAMLSLMRWASAASYVSTTDLSTLIAGRSYPP
jgi:peptidoglycan/LPS O-acetylase OafA/YrhL